MFITGGSGTGKSHVISVIKEHIEQAHTGSQNSCILTGPTGVSAFNIGAVTARTMPPCRTQQVYQTQLHVLRLLWKDAHTVVIPAS